VNGIEAIPFLVEPLSLCDPDGNIMFFGAKCEVENDLHYEVSGLMAASSQRKSPV
jgi:hypothetical protein